MTLDHIDATVDTLGDHFLVPIVKGLTDRLRVLEARIRELEGGADVEAPASAEPAEAYAVAGEPPVEA